MAHDLVSCGREVKSYVKPFWPLERFIGQLRLEGARTPAYGRSRHKASTPDLVDFECSSCRDGMHAVLQRSSKNCK